MVLAYHLKLALFKSGFLGVTVFFVLSGYLITGILISEVEEEGTIDLKNFWLRRIRRLVPAVMSMAVVIIFVSAVVNRVIFTKGCKDFLASVLGFNNWWQIFNKVSYFEAAGVPSPFTHCWSLAIETQFYLIYPLILLGIYKLVKSRGEGRAKRGLLFAGVTLLLALISVILMIVLFDPQQDASGHIMDRHESIFPFIRCITCNSVGLSDGSKKTFSQCQYGFGQCVFCSVARDDDSNQWFQ
mgnify:CR=1 FL=1